jgi:hypothetical protein
VWTKKEKKRSRQGGSRGNSFSFRTSAVEILIVSSGQIGDKEERYCSPALFCLLRSSSRSKKILGSYVLNWKILFR